MIFNEGIVTGDRWHEDPGVRTDALEDLAEAVHYLLNKTSPGGTVYNIENTPARFKKIYAFQPTLPVFRDKETGHFVKLDRTEDAEAQFYTMNRLNTALATRADVGVAAVRHACLIVPKSESTPTASIIEPAPGTSIYDLFIVRPDDGDLRKTYFRTGSQRAVEVVQERLAEVLETQTRMLLASDVQRANIFYTTTENDKDLYTLIDQPRDLFSRAAREWIAKRPPEADLRQTDQPAKRGGLFSRLRK